MASRDEVTLPAIRRPKSRKSIAHTPSVDDNVLDKENMTTDLGSLTAGKRDITRGARPAKRSRSKSIGPGGLDSLKEGSGNRRQSITNAPLPRSILKPTIAPLQEIPARSSSTSTPKKTTRPTSIPPTPPTQQPQVLIDFNLTEQSPNKPGAGVTGADHLSNPFQIGGKTSPNEMRVRLRTEEEQQSAVREREQKEKAETEKELKARREARRKSLANRRVSFAPEATLHTWDVVEYNQDSTTSSAATNLSRRASYASNATPDHHHSGNLSSDPSEPPSTPPQQIEEDASFASPAHQRDLHQKKRRRSSGIPPMNFNNPDDVEGFSSSPYSGSSIADDDEGNQEFSEDVEDSESNGNSDDEGTMTDVDDNETTNMSMASIQSDDMDTGSSARLEKNLRLAANQAGNGGTGNMDKDEEVVASFQPWAKKGLSLQQLSSQNDQEDEVTMEMTKAIGGIISSGQEDSEGMTMDITQAIGGILPNASTQRPTGRRYSTRRRSSGVESNTGDETMDLTVAVGSIKTSNVPSSVVEEDPDEHEDMTMEFTSVIGGVLPSGLNGRHFINPSRAPTSISRRDSVESDAGDEEMDITLAVGSILPVHRVNEVEPSVDEDQTMGMDITVAIGQILPSELNRQSRNQARQLMEMEGDVPDLGSSPFRGSTPRSSPPKLFSTPSALTAPENEVDSPSRAAFRGKSLLRSGGANASPLPKSPGKTATPLKKPATPPEQLTPQPLRPTTPGKTPPSKNVMMRSASPKRLFTQETTSSTPKPTTPNTASSSNRLFRKDARTGAATPNIVLTPQRRRISGLGIDKTGLGSPRVAALLDRRASIGDMAQPFTTSQPDDMHIVRFEDPRILEDQVDKERNEEESRENGRKILEREADQAQDENDATVNLKEMIESLSPKKKPLKGRKSLHVGAAKGILGKRPSELDDEDDEEQDGIKRLKGHQGSPVKNVRLQGPPSKAETTGRSARAASRKHENASESNATPTVGISPSKMALNTTPHGQGRFRDAEANSNDQSMYPFEPKATNEVQVMEINDEDDRVHLQDFLNMTSIRFMELTTTKRRHTVAPNAHNNDADAKAINADEYGGLESCVVAGACTVPMLELYQHSCRELKKYISEGRSVVREIETETFEENPPLFREYISATPDMKVYMDNQFKNVKTHARLLSKGMWYEWRMKLLDGLRDGLDKVSDEMAADYEVLQRRQELLNSVLPDLLEYHSHLEQVGADLQTAVEELASCDQVALSESRQALVAVDVEVDSKQQLLAKLQAQLRETELGIETAVTKRHDYQHDIKEAEKVREECRGWTTKEITLLKSKVEALESEYGWTITGVSGTITSMTYHREIELVFDASTFMANGSRKPTEAVQNSRIDLWYIASSRDMDPQPLTPEKDFFLQNIRDHIRGLPQAQTPVKVLLNSVSNAWNRASTVVNDICSLKLNYPTETTKTSDSSIVVRSGMLLKSLATKVEMVFDLNMHSTSSGIDILLDPFAHVVYGQNFNEPKMKEYMLSRIGSCIVDSRDGDMCSWDTAVADLAEKLLARGRK